MFAEKFYDFHVKNCFWDSDVYLIKKNVWHSLHQQQERAGKLWFVV